MLLLVLAAAPQPAGLVIARVVPRAALLLRRPNIADTTTDSSSRCTPSCGSSGCGRAGAADLAVVLRRLLLLLLLLRCAAPPLDCKVNDAVVLGVLLLLKHRPCVAEQLESKPVTQQGSAGERLAFGASPSRLVLGSHD